MTTPLPSLSANNSASLFSKPSPLSVENGHVVRVGANPEHLGINELDRQLRPLHGLREHFSGQKHGRDRRA